MEQFEQKKDSERKEKPEVLYVGYPTRKIETLEPRRGRYRDKDEGAVIFSTPDEALATVFTIPGHGDDVMKIGYYGDDVPVVILSEDRDEFIKNDRGGSVYTVSSDTFDYDPDKGMGDREWTSRVPVDALSETDYPSSLDAMIEHGVKVYFVDKETFQKIKDSNDRGFSILIGQETENERRGHEIKSISDLRSMNLVEADLRNITLDALLKCDFDSQTIWPATDKLPVGFDPERVMEDGKNPGLGVRELHEQGITGRGIHVAIIDQKLDKKHSEYFDNLSDYNEIAISEIEEISMHGPAVASLLVGKKCGIAPEARLHYWSAPAGSRSRWEYYTRALGAIVDYNETVGEEEKVKVISCSVGYPNDGFGGDLEQWVNAITRAKENGVVFIDAKDIVDMNFLGGGSPSDKDDVDQYRDYLYGGNDKEWVRGKIIVPSDYRTFASSWNKKDKDGTDEYCYSGKGGISWSVPYLAGIFSLMLQIKGDLKRDKMVEIIYDTVSINKNGKKVINPRGIIEAVKKLK